MKKWKAYVTGLAAMASLSGSLWAQVPAVPAAPAAPGVPGVPAATPVGGLHQFLGLTPEIKEAKKRRICATQFGMLMGNMMAPLRVFSGGILGNCCPGPSLADTLKPGPEGAANKIKKDEAEAKARRAAVRYLGTVDCHFWPEAEGALIGALRADRNECVRFEAAMALGGGCCCTKKTIEALLISATCSDRDGNPSETCDRVRAAAFASLQHCLSCFSEEVPGDLKKPEKPEVPKPEKPEKIGNLGLDGNVQLTAYYTTKLDNKPMSLTVREAREAVAGSNIGFRDRHGLPNGEKGIVNILAAGLGLFPMDTDKVAATGQPIYPGQPTPSERVVTSEQMPVGPEVKVIHSEVVPLKTGLFGPSTPAVEMKTMESKPVEVKPAVKIPAKPVSAKPAETKPMAAKPAETKPMAVKPVEMKPMAAKPAEAKPLVDSKPMAVKPVDSKPMVFDTKPMVVDSKPMASKPVDMKPMVESKPMVAEIKPAIDNKLVAAKPVEMKPMTEAPRPVATAIPPRLPETLPASAPVAQVHAVTNGPNPQQLLVVLRNSIYPFQREWAVDNLSNCDWKSNPDVVQALMSAARKDPAPTVRVMCIRSLVKMKCETMPVVTTIQSLRADPDPRVEHEAQVALNQMGHGVTTVASGVQPASATAAPASTGTVTPASWNGAGKPTQQPFGVGYPR